MARVTYVKSARQRYEMVTVLGEDNRPVRTAVTRADGSAKTTKSGREVSRTKTVADKTKPLPPENCGKCGNAIPVGSPYKWIAPKSGPYGGRRLVRCDSCPTWYRWEYSNSLSARTEEIAHNFNQGLGDVESVDDVESLLSEAASAIREIAEEKRESASNIEDGFGHETEQSAELNDIADQLESWADDVEGVQVPDAPDPEDEECSECEGAGTIESEDEGQESYDCDECSGSGTASEVSEESMDEWRENVESECSVIEECPV